MRPGGTFLFNVWDRIEDNEFADCVTQAMAGLFPGDPPQFLARVPHGYNDEALISAALLRGGFTGNNCFNSVTAQSVAASAAIVATAYCQGTPLRNEIQARDANALGRATDIAATAMGQRFGTDHVSGKIQAIVVAAQR